MYRIAGKKRTHGQEPGKLSLRKSYLTFYRRISRSTHKAMIDQVYLIVVGGSEGWWS